jgi:hypothetical protein
MLTKIMKWTAIVALLLAVLRLPILDYRIMLGIVVCVSGLLIALQSIHDGRFYWAAGFFVLVILFNPVVPLRLSRMAFIWLDLVCLAVFLASLATLKQKPISSLPSITDPLPPHESL